jgi:hypothetical protein
MTTLEHFLRTTGSYDKFVKNYEIARSLNDCKRTINSFMTTYGENDAAVSYAFEWRKTDEGLTYWMKTSENFVRYITIKRAQMRANDLSIYTNNI